MYLYFNVNEAGGVGYANRRGTFMTLYVVCINGYIMYIFYLKSRVSYYISNLNLMHTEQEYLYAAMNYNYANNYRK